MEFSKISEDQEIDIAVQRMIESINDVLKRTELAARRAEAPRQFDLRSACEYKGGDKYESVRKANYKQPLCGYYTHWEDTPQRRKPRWTYEQVDRWACVSTPQRSEYIEELLYGDYSEIAAGVLHMLIADIEAGRLPEYLRDVVDEYVETVKGRAV